VNGVDTGKKSQQSIQLFAFILQYQSIFETFQIFLPPVTPQKYLKIRQKVAP
jgi:hypothetical protein